MQNPNLQKFNLTDFSYEILFNILLNAEPKDIANYCQTSKRASEICKNQDFWRMKLWKDYGKMEQVKGRTWKEQYQSGPIRVINSPITAGKSHYGIIDDQGDLYMAGYNNDGQLGNGTWEQSQTLGKVSIKSKVISVDTNEGDSPYTGAITEEGYLYVWGYIRTKLKNEWFIRKNTPHKIDLQREGKPVKIIIDKGSDYYGIIMDDGSAYANVFNEGRVMEEVHPKFVHIQPDPGRKIVDAIIQNYMFQLKQNGCLHVSNIITLDNYGDVYFYYGYHGGNHDSIKYKIKMDFPDPIKQLSSSASVGMALSTKGDVYNWGGNVFQSELGVPNDQKAVFHFLDIWVYKIDIPVSINFIMTGMYDMFSAVTNSGTVYVWGSNNYNKLIGKEEERKLVESGKMHQQYVSNPNNYFVIPFPIELKLKSKIQWIALGHTFTIAVTEDGMVNYWGDPKWGPENT